jgi:hypothetical protein
VKLIRRHGDSLSFQLSQAEKRFLLDLLRHYPLVSPAHQRLSKTVPEADQKLLQEALTAQQTENQKLLQALLEDPNRFRPQENQFQFSLSRPQVEWLLQVLNDIRIGSWLLLGSPDDQVRNRIELNEKTAPYLLALEISGKFQTDLLRALDDLEQAGPAPDAGR